MTKKEVLQIRLSEVDKSAMRETATNGGWSSIADMIRALVSQAAEKQSREPLAQTEQRQHDHQPDEPQL